MKEKYNIEKLEDMAYYLKYTGDMSSLAKEFNTTENVIKAMLLLMSTGDRYIGAADVHKMMKCLNQTDTEWMEYLSEKYNKNTLRGIKYYLDYTGEIDGVLKEFGVSEEVLMVMLLAHSLLPDFVESDANMQSIIEEMRAEYPQNSSYIGKISDVSTIRDLKNYLKFTDDMKGLVKKFGTTPEIIKALVCSYPVPSLLFPKLDYWKHQYGDINVQCLLDTMQELDCSIEKCLHYLREEKYGYIQAHLVNEVISTVNTIRDMMYYAAFTGDIEGLSKRFSTTKEIIKSVIWYYSENNITLKDEDVFAQTTIEQWQEKFKQEFDKQDSPISSVRTVRDMSAYLDITGDIDGLSKKFGITEGDIDEMIQDYTGWNSDLTELQCIIDNPGEEASLAYERYHLNPRDLARIALCLQNERKYLCGIGFRFVRSFLSKKYKLKRDKIAQIYQLAMDIEDKSIKTRTVDWFDCNLSYEEYKKLKVEMEVQKFKLLRKLISCYKKTGYEYGWRAGYRERGTYYLYFDLPSKKQVSFRTILSEKEKAEIPKYIKRWNGMSHSTLDIIQDDLMLQYPELEEIRKKRSFRMDEETMKIFRDYIY